MKCPHCEREIALVEKDGRLQGFCKIKGIMRCVIDMPALVVSNPEFPARTKRKVKQNVVPQHN